MRAVADSSREIRAVGLGLTPEEALAAWPAGEPLAVLWSGGGGAESRCTVLARPSGVSGAVPGSAGEAKAFIEAELRAAGVATGEGDIATKTSPWHPGPEFLGGVIFALAYPLGGMLEPAVGTSRHASTGPLIQAWRVEDALIYDHHRSRWFAVGSPPTLAVGGFARGFRVAGLRAEGEAAGFEAGVERVLEYIRAGDVYQVNLAHRLSARIEGSTRGFFAALMGAARPWYGAYLETETGTVCSASPELFLTYDPARRRLLTRPMKGTRPAGREGELAASEKDAAELNMITDLMRNDIGRVSELGSVAVEQTRSFERHNQLVQTTSTVTGTLRAGLSFVDALLSAFPGGSVTGCPKVRAMQIIDELEACGRGMYCGAIGYISRSGHAAFNIAIRTAVIEGDQLTYHAGAGIVVDSDPAAEWQETLDKAGILSRVASHNGETSPAP